MSTKNVTTFPLTSVQSMIGDDARSMSEAGARSRKRGYVAEGGLQRYAATRADLQKHEAKQHGSLLHTYDTEHCAWQSQTLPFCEPG